AEPGCHDEAPDPRRDENEQTGRDLDDSDEVHEVLRAPRDDVVDPGREVLRPVHRPVEELVEPEQDRCDDETDAKQHEHLVARVTTASVVCGWKGQFATSFDLLVTCADRFLPCAYLRRSGY